MYFNGVTLKSPPICKIYKIYKNVYKSEMTLDCTVSLHRLLKAVKGHFWEFLVSNIIGYLSFCGMDAACQRNANQNTLRYS